MVKYFLLWLPMIIIAFANASIREVFLVRSLSEKSAHQVSTTTLIVFLGIYMFFVLRKWPFDNMPQAVATGVVWSLATVAFEFGLGMATRHPIQELLQAYNLPAGELWALVPLFILAFPIIFYHLTK